MFKIGILDDNEVEMQITEIALLKGSGAFDNNVSFIEYSIKDFQNADDLIKRIFEDILNDAIDGLIIDESMIMDNGDLHGSSIFEFINRKIPEYPIIILTNYDRQAIENIYVDPDKVYKKIDFYLIDNEISQKLCNSFFRNVQRCKSITEDLKLKISCLEEDLKKIDFNNENIISEIYNAENELSKYLPVYENTYGSFLKSLNIDDVVKEIEKVDELLNEDI